MLYPKKNCLCRIITSKDISEKILFQKKQSDEEQSFFRQYSVNTSNDPEEGKTLLHYLFPYKKISLQVEEHGAFAGCFTFNYDSLNQFRLYGKANKEEGTGISIAFNKNFFNMKSIVLPTKKSTEELSIFRCIYIDTETDTIVSLGHKEESVFLRENKKVNYQEYIDDINRILKDVKKELKELKELVRNWESKNLDYNVICKLLLPLRYMIKNAAFKEEQECRIIQTKKITDPNVSEDENNRFYVDYYKLSPKNVAKIVFGPKAKDIDKFRQCLARNRYNGIECYQSKVPLA